MDHFFDLFMRSAGRRLREYVERILSSAMLPNGRTAPMLMGACDAYTNRRGITPIDRILDAAKDRLDDARMFRLREEGDPDLDRALEHIKFTVQEIPRTLMFYLRLRRDEPLMVELPSWDHPMFEAPAVKAVDPRADVDQTASMLLAQYHDPVHYNTWLWYAHGLATFRGSQPAEYAAYIRRLLNDPGARRARMGLGT